MGFHHTDEIRHLKKNMCSLKKMRLTFMTPNFYEKIDET